MSHTILAKAQKLNRRIYASLPWGYRVAHLFLKLSFSLTDTLGKILYAQFIQAGVKGLPPINGTSALSTPETLVKHPERLPTGYGKGLGERIYGFLLKKVRNPDTVEEIIGDFMLRVSKGQFKPNAGISLSKADQYTFMMVTSVMNDYFDRAKRNPKQLEMDEEGVELDLEDPHAFSNIEDMLPQREIEEILREIKRVHPYAPAWFQAQLEGMTDTELAEQLGVSKPRISQLTQKFVPAVKQVILEHLRDAS